MGKLFWVIWMRLKPHHRQTHRREGTEEEEAMWPQRQRWEWCGHHQETPAAARRWKGARTKEPLPGASGGSATPLTPRSRTSGLRNCRRWVSVAPTAARGSWSLTLVTLWSDEFLDRQLPSSVLVFHSCFYFFFSNKRNLKEYVRKDYYILDSKYILNCDDKLEYFQLLSNEVFIVYYFFIWH